VIRGILKASLPTIVVPAIFVSLVINFFGITIDSLLAMIFLGQFYIIWGQLEVALRQTRLSALEYEPEFKIEVEKRTIKLKASDKILESYNIKLKNVSKHLARNIFVAVDAKPQDAGRNKPELKSLPIANIAPDDIVNIHSYDGDVFEKSKISINLDYTNALGEFGAITFFKEPRFYEFMTFGTERRMPGILLNSFEDLSLIFRAVALPRRIKRYKESQGNKK
jgi:hypothetical protein